MMRRDKSSSSWLVVMAIWVLFIMCSYSSASVVHHVATGADACIRGSSDVSPRSSDKCRNSIDHTRCQNEEMEVSGGDRRIEAKGIMVEAFTSIDRNSDVTYSSKGDIKLEYGDQCLYTRSQPTSVSYSIARSATDSPLSRVLSLRGGQAINQTKKLSTTQKIRDALNMLLPATRVYLLMSIVCTVAQLLGVVDVGLLGLNPKKLLQLWRPLTSVSYLGTPSWVMAYQVFYIISYGQNLELGSGTGVHAWFLLTQTITLTILGLLLNMPLLSRSMIASIVYVSCRINPFEQTNIQFGITISMWQMPYFLMIADCLTMQTMEAAWPYVLGIFSGHIYHFLTAVWPALGGREWLKTPALFIKLLGDKPNNNFKPGGDKAPNLTGKLPKFTKSMKGRKLGS